jgi:hypothetical protein
VPTATVIEQPSSSIVLDTRTLLWLVSTLDEVSARAREAISNPARVVTEDDDFAALHGAAGFHPIRV